jgi:hypothetical protein
MATESVFVNSNSTLCSSIVRINISEVRRMTGRAVMAADLLFRRNLRTFFASFRKSYGDRLLSALHALTALSPGF